MTSTRRAGPARPLLIAALLILAAALAAALLRPRTDTATQPPAQASQASGSLPATVTDARVVAVPPGIRETSVFATLRSTWDADVRITGVSSPAAGHVMLMVTRTQDNMTGMSMTGSLTIPAGGTLTLSDTGDHLMLMDLKEPLQPGQTIPITLTDAEGRTLTILAPVTKP
ncbi:copper chaperone PCu(A)C [Deinococcus sp. RM]|uniref:copper chaperone PCu(A)C n=1 Tax=Deinococcus sp. RM TaxID=2316359 RepID=UPI000E68DE75|nr:copper chaperone PCu(A)C [Deinococcus sp. RM]RIX99462.1 copper chaperone PCu(A)C [Deinococcus sp. RM]